jgi:hypothetical protein
MFTLYKWKHFVIIIFSTVNTMCTYVQLTPKILKVIQLHQVKSHGLVQWFSNRVSRHINCVAKILQCVARIDNFLKLFKTVNSFSGIFDSLNQA